MRLKNKIALITGAASGIGRATAELFINEGAVVYVTDINDSDGEELAKELGVNANYLHLDAAEEADWQKVIAEIDKKHGKLDVLFNNAGIIGFSHDNMQPQDPENCTLEHWRCINRVNSDSVFLGCKYGIGLMKKSDDAAIINMSSRSGLVGVPTAVAYAASKAAIRNHTKSVGLYCASQGYKIRCNAVEPAAILTPLWAPMLGDDRDAGIEKLASTIPMGRLGKPEEVASVVLFLACKDSSYLTGAEITIDGGILAGTASSPGVKK